MGQFETGQHPSTEILIEFMDGSAATGVADHLAHCGRCQEVLQDIGQTRRALSALPLREPPAQVWEGIRTQLADCNERAGGGFSRQLWLSMAASVMLLGLAVYLVAPVDDILEPVVDGALVAETRNLESMLSYLDHQEKPMTLQAAARIARIEDSIGAIDRVIDRPAEAEASAAVRQNLLERRVDLLRNLVAARAQPMTAAYHAY